MQPSATVSVFRATINQANAQRSTGPRTESGKRRSSLNALRHGLTARTAVIPSEDPAAYEQHCRQFENEYKPATPTETQLVQELADTSWRLKRIPLLEADIFAVASPQSPTPSPGLGAPSPQSLIPQLASSIQFERRHQERRDLRDAADLLELHKHKDVPWQPSDHGFVFSKQQVERHAERLMRQNEARHIGAVRFSISPQLARPYLSANGL